jgi:ketosteroid isomerase-like protein
VDHAATMRKTYERINAGDIAGFGDLVAEDFVEHQGLPDLPTKEGTLEFFRVLLAAFPDWRMTVGRGRPTCGTPRRRARTHRCSSC